MSKYRPQRDSVTGDDEDTNPLPSPVQDGVGGGAWNKFQDEETSDDHDPAVEMNDHGNARGEGEGQAAGAAAAVAASVPAPAPEGANLQAPIPADGAAVAVSSSGIIPSPTPPPEHETVNLNPVAMETFETEQDEQAGKLRAAVTRRTKGCGVWFCVRGRFCYVASLILLLIATGIILAIVFGIAQARKGPTSIGTDGSIPNDAGGLNGGSSSSSTGAQLPSWAGPPAALFSDRCSAVYPQHNVSTWVSVTTCDECTRAGCGWCTLPALQPDGTIQYFTSCREKNSTGLGDLGGVCSPDIVPVQYRVLSKSTLMDKSVVWANTPSSSNQTGAGIFSCANPALAEHPRVPTPPMNDTCHTGNSGRNALSCSSCVDESNSLTTATCGYLTLPINIDGVIKYYSYCRTPNNVTIKALLQHPNIVSPLPNGKTKLWAQIKYKSTMSTVTNPPSAMCRDPSLLVAPVVIPPYMYNDSDPCWNQTSCNTCRSIPGCGWCTHVKTSASGMVTGVVNSCRAGSSTKSSDNICMGYGSTMDPRVPSAYHDFLLTKTWSQTNAECTAVNGTATAGITLSSNYYYATPANFLALSNVGNCKAYSGSCSGCTAQSSCGWCGSSSTNGTCVSGYSSYSPLCTSPSQKWAWLASSCPAGPTSPPAPVNCSQWTASGCATCTAKLNCGWCSNSFNNGSCVQGSSESSPFCNAPTQNWAYVSNECPGQDALANCSQWTASGCQTCTAKANCGWCSTSGTNGTCVYGHSTSSAYCPAPKSWSFFSSGCPAGPTTPAPPVNCSRWTSSGCSTCTAQASCGWCSTSPTNGTCVQGTSASSPSCPAPQAWAWVSGSCPAVAPNCAQWTSSGCDTCTAQASCGWCGTSRTNGSCVAGTSSASSPNCPASSNQTWAYVSTSCPGPTIPPPPVNCSQWTAAGCATCASKASCGWCSTSATNGTCVQGTSSSSPSCPAPQSWAYLSGECPADSAQCAQWTSSGCQTCTAKPACGWCSTSATNGTCVPGSSSGSSSFCPAPRAWAFLSSSCPSGVTTPTTTAAPPTTPAPTGCAQWTSSGCGTCTAQPSCGWCGSTRTNGSCVAGTSSASSPNCPASSNLTWAYVSTSCPGPTVPPPPVNCSQWTGCSTCVTKASCGWCSTSATNGSCVEGNSGSSAFCTAPTQSWSYTSCPVDPATVNCSQWTSSGCATCTAKTSCGWCSSSASNGSCVVGSSSSSPSCPAASGLSWTYFSSSCPTSPPVPTSPPTTLPPTGAPPSSPPLTAWVGPPAAPSTDRCSSVYPQHNVSAWVSTTTCDECTRAGCGWCTIPALQPDGTIRYFTSCREKSSTGMADVGGVCSPDTVPPEYRVLWTSALDKFAVWANTPSSSPTQSGPGITSCAHPILAEHPRVPAYPVNDTCHTGNSGRNALSCSSCVDESTTATAATCGYVTLPINIDGVMKYFTYCTTPNRTTTNALVTNPNIPNPLPNGKTKIWAATKYNRPVETVTNPPSVMCRDPSLLLPPVVIPPSLSNSTTDVCWNKTTCSTCRATTGCGWCSHVTVDANGVTGVVGSCRTGSSTKSTDNICTGSGTTKDPRVPPLYHDYSLTKTWARTAADCSAITATPGTADLSDNFFFATPANLVSASITSNCTQWTSQGCGVCSTKGVCGWCGTSRFDGKCVSGYSAYSPLCTAAPNQKWTYFSSSCPAAPTTPAPSATPASTPSPTP